MAGHTFYYLRHNQIFKTLSNFYTVDKNPLASIVVIGMQTADGEEKLIIVHISKIPVHNLLKYLV
jgi:hypothetical protein